MAELALNITNDDRALLTEYLTFTHGLLAERANYDKAKLADIERLRDRVEAEEDLDVMSGALLYGILVAAQRTPIEPEHAAVLERIREIVDRDGADMLKTVRRSRH